jgi:putative SOS response-associated peptidase YedK
VLADGYYEWIKVAGGKQPYYFHMPEHQPFAFAGLWESWDKGGLGPLETCTIITTQANEQTRPFHDRMPVILDPVDYDRWMLTDATKATDLVDLLAPLPAGRLAIDPVSKLVNNARNDDENCIVAT